MAKEVRQWLLDPPQNSRAHVREESKGSPGAPPPHPLLFLSPQSLRPCLSLTSAWLARGGEKLVFPEEKRGAQVGRGWRRIALSQKSGNSGCCFFVFLDVQAGLEFVTTILSQSPRVLGLQVEVIWQRAPKWQTPS